MTVQAWPGPAGMPALDAADPADPRDLGRYDMEPTITSHEAVGHHDLHVHKWRVSQLTRLGIPELLAEVYADRLDWHQIARLVQRGCPVRLAIRIAR